MGGTQEYPYLLRGRERHRTGDGAGISRARGANVVVADLSEDGNQETSRKIEELSAHAARDRVRRVSR